MTPTLTTATERPILFNPAMVAAILDGRKTQTRRGFTSPVRPEQVRAVCPDAAGNWLPWGGDNTAPEPTPDQMLSLRWHSKQSTAGVRCPYGTPGDLLYVREEHYRFGHWELLPGQTTKGGKPKWAFVADTDEVRFDAPASFRKGLKKADAATPAWYKRLARFMPRRYARLTLRITAVRVERAQDISEADAIAEGVERLWTPEAWRDAAGIRASYPDYKKTPYLNHLWHGNAGLTSAQEASWPYQYSGYDTAAEAFSSLWAKINGAESWAANPFVWVVSFRRITP